MAEPKFTISGRIARPVHQVFEAVADPAELSRYFTTGGAEGRLETGATVQWDFHDFPGAFPVDVVEVEPDRRIVLRWAANEGGAAAGYQTTVTFTFEPVDGNRTLVKISEEGWRDTPAGLRASYSNCEGWTGMLCAMKVWLEHGIRLREDFYK
jgi:uncharacterized protein YndB with AHSA1/START domain